MSKTSNPCPARCIAAKPTQHDVDEEALSNAGILGDWKNRAMRCAHCGEIYSNEPHGKIRRGYFKGNTLMTAENWQPFNG